MSTICFIYSFSYYPPFQRGIMMWYITHFILWKKENRLPVVSLINFISIPFIFSFQCPKVYFIPLLNGLEPFASSIQYYIHHIQQHMDQYLSSIDQSLPQLSLLFSSFSFLFTKFYQCSLGNELWPLFEMIQTFLLVLKSKLNSLPSNHLLYMYDCSVLCLPLVPSIPFFLSMFNTYLSIIRRIQQKKNMFISQIWIYFNGSVLLISNQIRHYWMNFQQWIQLLQSNHRIC